MTLTKRSLRRDDLLEAQLREFGCGALQRDIDVIDFFRTAETIEKVEAQEVQAWLYFDADGNLVAVSSLAKTSWHYPKVNDPSVPIQIIPNLAVSGQHQGNGYSKMVLDDTIFEALKLAEESDMLALFVHVENEIAIKLYLSRGFQPFGKPMKRTDGRYQRMILLL